MTARLPAVVLSCDRYHPLAAHTILQYQRLWPSHPFTFHVPYQARPLEGQDIVPRRTAEPIRATVLELLAPFGDEDWIYWCVDDKYPIHLSPEPAMAVAAALLAGECAQADGLLLCRCRRLLRPERLFGGGLDGPGGIHLLRRRDYSQIWIHQFLRAKVLRRLFEGFPESIHRARDLDALKDQASLPADHRLYVAEVNLAVFGESTTGGRLTRNCAESFRALGLPPPDGFEVTDRSVVMGVVADGPAAARPPGPAPRWRR